MAKRIVLTKEEKIMRDFFVKYIIEKDNKVTQPAIKKYVESLVNARNKRTGYNDSRIKIKNEVISMGSMERDNGKTKMSVNFEQFLEYFASPKLDDFDVFVELTDTGIHEPNHHVQFNEAERIMGPKVGSKKTFSQIMSFGREIVAEEVDQFLFYKGNYDYTAVEIDSRRTADIELTRALLRVIPQKYTKYRKKVIDRMIKNMDKNMTEYKNFKFDNSDRVYSREEVTSAYVDQGMAAKPYEFFKKAPVLMLEYDMKTGRRLTLIELYYGKQQKMEDIDNNEKLTEEHKIQLKNQLDAAYGTIMYNEAIREAEDPVSFRNTLKIAGKEDYLELIKDIKKGQAKIACERLHDYMKYDKIASKCSDLLTQAEKQTVKQKIKTVAGKLGVNWEEYENLQPGEYLESVNNKETKRLNDIEKLVNDINVQETSDKKEIKRLHDEIVARNEIARQNDEKAYYKRQLIVEPKKKAEEEKRKRLEKEYEEKQRIKKMQELKKSPLVVAARKIGKMLFGKKQKALPAGKNVNLSQRRYKIEELTSQKEELEEEFITLKEDAELQMMLERVDRMKIEERAEEEVKEVQTPIVEEQEVEEHAKQ